MSQVSRVGVVHPLPSFCDAGLDTIAAIREGSIFGFLGKAMLENRQ